MVMWEEFLAKLAAILEIDGSKLSESVELNDDNWDSVAHLAAIAAIDEQFGITVPSRELTQCTSVGALLKLVRHSLPESGEARPLPSER
jgi:acyl carrier protein